MFKKKAAEKVLEYLKSFGKKVILIAHSCNFDSDRIVRLYDKFSMIESLEEVVLGFVDTLALFRKQFPERKGHKLADLAKDLLELSVDNAHNALFDIDILEKLTTKFLTWSDLSKNLFSIKDVSKQIQMHINEKRWTPSYAPMFSIFSKVLIKNLSRNNVDFSFVIDKFIESDESLKNFLMDGQSPFIKSNKTMETILEYLNLLKDIIERGLPKVMEDF